MRLPLQVLACTFLFAASCSPPPFDLIGCLEPPDLASQAALSLPALVDRADVIVLVKVAKAERTYTDYYHRIGARRLTLDSVDIAKGTAPARFILADGPCPMLVATEGESFVALLEPTPDRSSLKPIGLPASALRPTPQRTLAQLMDEIRSIRPLDGEARALFERYGWKVTAKHDFGEFDLPSRKEFGSAGRQLRGAAFYINQPLETYARLAEEIGLDPRPYAAKRVERLSFWLENAPPEYREGTPFGHVLIGDRRIVAAWVTVFPEGGPFSVRDRARAITAPSARPSFPPMNRFPGGVNVADMYDLARATSIQFKTGAGEGGTVVDVARVRAFAAALDVTLPTKQATTQGADDPNRYYLHFNFDSSSVSLDYDAKGGVLTVLADGYSVEPGPAFASLIAGIR